MKPTWDLGGVCSTLPPGSVLFFFSRCQTPVNSGGHSIFPVFPPVMKYTSVRVPLKELKYCCSSILQLNQFESPGKWCHQSGSLNPESGSQFFSRRCPSIDMLSDVDEYKLSKEGKQGKQHELDNECPVDTFYTRISTREPFVAMLP